MSEKFCCIKEPDNPFWDERFECKDCGENFITRCDGFRLKNQISAKDATIAELREENARLEMAGGILASTIASERTGQAPDGADWYWGDIWDAAKKGAKDIRAEQAK